MNSASLLHPDAPLWSSGFRPFYLLGTLYAPLLVAGAAGAAGGVVDLQATGATPVLWHGHEMVFGFAVAIIVGTLLAALPSWAGTAELRGRRLRQLALLWLLGRAAMWAGPVLPSALPALLDASLLPLLMLRLAPEVWRVPQRRWRLLLPVLAALAAANVGYHVSLLGGDAALAERCLRGGVYAVMVVFVIKGGVLTPIFTATVLEAQGRGRPYRFCWPLELLAVAAVLLLAALDLGGAPPRLTGAAALAAALVHALRCARWQAGRLRSDPWLWAMHLSFGWLLTALLLHAAALAWGSPAGKAWLHAFTVGSLGLMMLGLMTRVTLRHTGRELVVPRLLLLAYVMVFAAALLRWAAAQAAPGVTTMVVSALLWATAFGLYALRCSAWLVAPSLPARGDR